VDERRGDGAVDPNHIAAFQLVLRALASSIRLISSQLSARITPDAG
jgi:hypothetical protein